MKCNSKYKDITLKISLINDTVSIINFKVRECTLRSIIMKISRLTVLFSECIIEKGSFVTGFGRVINAINIALLGCQCRKVCLKTHDYTYFNNSIRVFGMRNGNDLHGVIVDIADTVTFSTMKEIIIKALIGDSRVGAAIKGTMHSFYECDNLGCAIDETTIDRDFDILVEEERASVDNNA